MTQPKKLIVLDLDDTLHEAENHLMGKGWNHLLAPWKGFFKDYGQDKTELRAAPAPGLGVNTRQVIEFFINRLGIHLDQTSESELTKLGFNQANIEELMFLREEESQKQDQYRDLDNFLTGVYTDDSLPDEAKLDYSYLDRITEERLKARGVTSPDEISRLLAQRDTKRELMKKTVAVLERERIDCLLPIVRKEGVKTIPGALEMVALFKEAGYEAVIVTQSPLELARAIFEKMGLLQDTIPVDRDKIEVVAGTMVKKPKPDKEPIEKATWIIRWDSDKPLRDTLKTGIMEMAQAHEFWKLKEEVREKIYDSLPKLIGQKEKEEELGRKLDKQERENLNHENAEAHKHNLQRAKEEQADLWKRYEEAKITLFGDIKTKTREGFKAFYPGVSFEAAGIVGDSGSDVSAAKNMRDAGYSDFRAVIVGNEFNRSSKAQEGLRKKGDFQFVDNLSEVTPALFDRPPQGIEAHSSGKERL